MDHALTVLFVCSITATAVAFCCGLALLLLPAPFQAAAERLDRWHSSTAVFEILDRPRYIERRIYRHHRLAGTAIVLGASYTLVRLAGLHIRAATTLLPEAWDSVLRDVLVESAWTAVMISNMAAVILGLIVYFRPSLLKQTEHTANRWLSTNGAARALDTPHIGLDSWFWAHPRLAGLGMMSVATYICGVLVTCYYRLW